MTGVDTSAEAVEALAASLTRSFPAADWGGVDRALVMGECGVDALVLLDAQATLRALAAERDALRAALRTLIGISNELTWKPSTRPIAARMERIISEALLGSKGKTP